MLVGKVQHTVEEKERFARVRNSLRPGLLMRVRIGDFHEDDETPVGFLAHNDLVMLIERGDGGPVVDKDSREVGRWMQWTVMTRWGILKKSESYIEQLWEPVESSSAGLFRWLWRKVLRLRVSNRDVKAKLPIGR
jgi:hypothetical protein